MIAIITLQANKVFRILNGKIQDESKAKDYKMLLIIINYTVRALIVVLGIIFVSGILNSYLSFRSDFQFLMPVMGVIFILWGVYRLITYHLNLRRYRNYENDEEV